MSKSRIAIVGAGVGGLSAAARLAHQGFEVDVFEKEAGPGGRCNRLSFDGFHFDTGPTLLLMPEVLEETFAATGRQASDYLRLHACDPNYRIHFRDQSSVTFFTDLVKMRAELDRVEPGSFSRYLEMLALGKEQYDVSLERFVGVNHDSVLGFFSPSNLASVVKIKAHRKMYAEVARRFADPRLRAALTFQTMYLGISPFESPAVYGLLPYTELAQGIWFPEGGLYAVPRALEQVGREEGVRFHYRAPVAKVLSDGQRATGLSMEDGSTLEFDAVLVNADLPWAYRKLLSDTPAKLKRLDSMKYTSSAFMMYLGVRQRLEKLQHHNVFFGRDYQGSFEDIFEKKVVPLDPSFYVNVPAHSDPSLAPEGKDGLYVLVPVPHQTAGIDWKLEAPKVRAKVFARLREELGEDVEPLVEAERDFTPDDWAASYNLDRGAAFGLSHHFFQVGPFRPANQDPTVRNVFFVGASTQPGTGLPMVMLSAKLVAERLERWAGAREPAAALAGAEAAA